MQQWAMQAPPSHGWCVKNAGTAAGARGLCGGGAASADNNHASRVAVERRMHVP